MTSARRLGRTAWRLAAAAAPLVVGLTLVGGQGAVAAPVPPSQFTCGVTDFSPCNQTAHFSDINEVGSPLQGGTGCPAFVSTDYVDIVGTGNGIEHSIVNNAGDGWFTSTFTGDVTLTAYPPTSISGSPDSPAISGPPDAGVPVFTGKITEWFGGSFNKQNTVFHDTIHVDATGADGSTLRVLDVAHTNTMPDPLAPPHSFEITRCG